MRKQKTQTQTQMPWPAQFLNICSGSRYYLPYDCILWTCIIARPFPQHQLMMKLQRLLVSITETDFDLKRLPYDWTGGKHKDVWLYAEDMANYGGFHGQKIDLMILMRIYMERNLQSLSPESVTCQWKIWSHVLGGFLVNVDLASPKWPYLAWTPKRNYFVF